MDSQHDYNILEEDCFNRHVLDIVINRWTGDYIAEIQLAQQQYDRRA